MKNGAVTRKLQGEPTHSHTHAHTPIAHPTAHGLLRKKMQNRQVRCPVNEHKTQPAPRQARCPVNESNSLQPPPHRGSMRDCCCATIVTCACICPPSRLAHLKTARRTSALLLLLAVCMAVSGVRVPPVDGSSTTKDWLDYTFYAMGLDRMVDHFEGILSGFAAV